MRECYERVVGVVVWVFSLACDYMITDIFQIE